MSCLVATSAKLADWASRMAFTMAMAMAGPSSRPELRRAKTAVCVSKLIEAMRLPPWTTRRQAV